MKSVEWSLPFRYRSQINHDWQVGYAGVRVYTVTLGTDTFFGRTFREFRTEVNPECNTRILNLHEQSSARAFRDFDLRRFNRQCA